LILSGIRTQTLASSQRWALMLSFLLDSIIRIKIGGLQTKKWNGFGGQVGRRLEKAPKFLAMHFTTTTARH
jgi:hypothetical protein